MRRSLPGDRSRGQAIAFGPNERLGRCCIWGAMRRLTGEDAGFLALELPNQPMHIMLLVILRNGAGTEEEPRQLTLDALRQHVEHLLGELPWMRWRLVRVPLGLYHPVVSEDPEFRVGDHVAEITLSSPADPAVLHRFCASQASQHLDRGHPLWQVILIHGLCDGRQALLFKVHHCLMDGTAARSSFGRFFGQSEAESAASEETSSLAQLPRAPRLTLDAVWDLLRLLPRLLGMIGRLIRAFRIVTRQRSGAVKVPNAGADTPFCSLHVGRTAARTYASTALDLDDLRRVKAAAGVSLNDVLLAVVAGGLVRYLEARNDLPAPPLVASVLVGFDSADAAERRFGNRVSALTTTLATDVKDPWDRLRSIHLTTAEAKRRFEEVGPELVPQCLEFIPPWIAEPAVRGIQRNQARHPDRVDHNVTISNFRGPSSLWSLQGSIAEEAYFSGPPTRVGGINVSAWSYAGKLMVSVLAVAESLVAPKEFVEDLNAALDELVRRAKYAGTPRADPG